MLAKRKKPFIAVQAIVMAAGFSQLLSTDAYYVPYLFVIIPAFICLFLNSKDFLKDGFSVKKSMRWLIGIFAFAYAIMVTLANYPMWIVGGMTGIFILAIVLLGSFFAFGNILLWIVFNTGKIEWKVRGNWKPLKVFFIAFAIMAVINIAILFLCNYPGNLTPDSIWQMQQLITNQYSNHHPFYDTLTIKVFVAIGYRLFHDINAAVACYSVFSILFMAASFSFSIATVDELHAPKWIVVVLAMFFALMPYHIMYSMTMWKDILFGAFVLLFTVFFFRTMAGMSMKPFNWIGLVISSFGVCLFRSNGYFAFVFTALCFLALFKLRKKKILAMMLIVLACSFVLKHPVLNALGVTQPDLIESLSVPAQQVARDVVDHNDLTDGQQKLLSKVIDIDQIKDNYNPGLSDPIKNLVRAKGNEDYIKEHAGQFIKLYFSLGAKHPFTFLRGWIDQTKGYWNAGYSYWRWSDGVTENDYGIYRTVKSEKVNALFDAYCSKFESLPPFLIFLSIGFFDWLMFLALFTSIVRKDRIGVMLSIPTIMTVFSLLVATPVFAEFRYDYAVFCALPIVLVLVLRPEDLVRGKEAA